MKTTLLKPILFTALVVMSLGDIHALPVISDLGIIAGDRGIAVSIGADAAFDAEFTGDNSTVSIMCRKCVNGLHLSSVDTFPPQAPVSKISVKEAPGAPLTITLYLKSQVTLPIKTINKNGQWIALLSNSSVAGYTWNNAEIPAREPAPITGQKIAEQPSATPGKEPATLKNVRMLERGQVCELAFEFDRKVAGQVKRDKNRISVSVTGAINGISKDTLLLPKNTVFTNVIVHATTTGQQTLLETSFTIDTVGTSPDFNVAFMEGEVLSLFLAKKKNSKATLWTSGHGLTVDYPFYDVPSYKVDMAFIEKRAIEDAARRLSRSNTFSIAEAYHSLTTAPEQPATAQAPVVTIKDTLHKADSIAPEMHKSVALSNVNIRSRASIKSAVCGKITSGDTVGRIEESGKWTKVSVNGKTGYVFAEYLSPVIPPIAITDKKELAAPPLQQQPEIPQENGITKVSTTLPSLDSVIQPAIDDQLTSDNFVSQVHDLPVLRSKIIEYHGAGRDPFMPITVDSMSATEFPSVEHLQLVGILIDNYDRIALCEEGKAGKRPFALREQDQVYKGKVLKIFKDKVVFLLTEYGISRSYTLTFAKNDADKEASLK